MHTSLPYTLESNTDSDSDSSFNSMEDESIVSTSFLHPSLKLSLDKMKKDYDLSSATILIFEKSPISRNHLINALRPFVKRLLVANGSEDAVALIKRNNSDPLQTRNSIRLIITGLDNSALRIAEHVEARLHSKVFSRMASIPILMTVEDSTSREIENHQIKLNHNVIIEQLSMALSMYVTVGYVEKTVSSDTIQGLVSGILAKYDGVFAAYNDLRAVKSEFHYPAFTGFLNMDSMDEYEMCGEDNDDNNSGAGAGAGAGIVSSEEETENENKKIEFSPILKEAWEKTKEQFGSSSTESGRLKIFAQNVMRLNKDKKKAAIMKQFTQGGTYHVDEVSQKN